MATPAVIERILAWLRAGYPQGVPQQDYVALFGILHRSLTDAEVEQIARAVEHQGAGDDDAIRTQIERLVHQSASDTDIQRVTDHLIAGGWPVETAADGTRHLKNDVDA